jgi:hypothetical protein
MITALTSIFWYELSKAKHSGVGAVVHERVISIVCSFKKEQQLLITSIIFVH